MKILHLLKKEFIEIIRQRELLFMMIIAPVFQLLVLGYIVTTDVKNVPVGIINHTTGKATTAIINRITHSDLFDVRYISRENRDSVKELKRSEIKSVIIFRDPVKSGGKPGRYPEVQILMDGVDSNTSRIAAGYFNGIIRNYILEDLNALGLSPLVRGKPLIRFNPELRSINYMGPGIVALLLTMITLFITSISLVREKEQQTIDTLLISRLTPFEIYIGKALPMILMGILNLCIGTLVAVLWFNIPVRGSLVYLILSALIYLAAISSYGMIISVFSTSQQQSLFFSLFSIITFILLSGLFTPLENIPAGLKWLVRINPLSYLIKIIREIFLKGNGIGQFYSELLSLALIALVISAISILNFKKFVSK